MTNTLNVGDVKPFKVGSPIDLTGDTVTLEYITPDGTAVRKPMTVGTTSYTAPDGTVYNTGFWCYFNTIATDFQKAGEYRGKLIIQSGANVYNADPFVFPVGGF